MDHLRISGPTRLCGTVRVSGSKNAALPIMAAAILAEEAVRLDGVPQLADVETLAQVLGELGIEVVRGCPETGTGSQMLCVGSDACARCRVPVPVSGQPPRDTGGELTLQTVDPQPVRARYELVRRMRASFCVLGPLLARRGKAIVSLPGGCNIGPRPVDLHLKGLAALGADLRIEHGYVIARAKRGKLRGAVIDLQGPYGPTVTGTANVLSAAVLAEGQTVIRGAAVEPEVVDLGNFLNRLGARITGLGTPTLCISGVRELGGASYRIIPDRIEAATLLLAAAVTQGSATVTGVVPEHLAVVLESLQAAGAEIEVAGSDVSIRAPHRPRPLYLAAAPYPGIPTDIQAQWMTLLSLAEGTSQVRDCVFPGRLMHVAELNRLGARIEVRNGTATVAGVPRLTGAAVAASDLRASAALVLAGLAAEGETLVRHAHHLDRGYERLDEKLGLLGARIERSLSFPVGRE